VARILIPLAFVAVAFWVVSIVDCAMQPEARHRGASKRVWVLITVVPVIGGILWWTIGRARLDQMKQAEPPVISPDDDPRFVASDERIRRLEEELAMLDVEDAFRADDAPGHDASDGDEPDEPDESDEPDDPRDARG